MSTLGMVALTSADVAFFSPPPHRPGRPERRRTRRLEGIAQTLFRAFRREVALALSHPNTSRKEAGR